MRPTFDRSKAAELAGILFNGSWFARLWSPYRDSFRVYCLSNRSLVKRVENDLGVDDRPSLSESWIKLLPTRGDMSIV